MSNPRHDLGAAAEDAVVIWLTDAGWQVLARRARSPAGGEVDIVALDADGILVGIEVRARRTPRTGQAATTVDARRAGRIGRTLAALASQVGVRHRGLRVDLVTVEPAGVDGQWRLARLAGIG